MFDFLVKAPQFFCLSDANYALRGAYARVSQCHFAGMSLLTHPRHLVERELAQLSRHVESTE
jgi:hypothetical protein